jgi:chemotaxis response regulator CheB
MTTPQKAEGMSLQEYLNQRYDDYIENIGTSKHGLYAEDQLKQKPIPAVQQPPTKPLNEYLKERHDQYIENIGTSKGGMRTQEQLLQQRKSDF